MEQARYWMSTKRKHDMTLSNNPSSYGDSWEEQAFAEDAAGALGGCIWPPRSYTCSFCRREFRSAQALGGHMNVHRRDRARMKQSPPSKNPSGDHQVFVPLPSSSLPIPLHHNSHVQYPSQICTFMYNPNSDSDPGAPVRVSSQKTLPTHPPSSFSSIVQEEDKNKLSSPPSSWSNLVADKYSCLPNVKNDEEKKLKSIDFKKEERNLEVMIDSNIMAKQDHVETNCKRRRVDHEEDDISFANIFPKTSSIERCRPQSEALERIPSAIEELDLELKL
ncbi:hypothetical protein HAX54_047672 [Datura stramonium]|uniref:C2H2-type domain-containing protein n=1 Tax=Datura stramonium TaxID=4076 RepID=A0ABS8WM94_DATST|nr:hypothetical protein [Datura stramonium]